MVHPSHAHVSLKPQPLDSFSADLEGDSSRRIRSGHGRSITITFIPCYEGRHEEVLELTFQDIRRNRRFSIARRIRATVGSLGDQEQLKAKGPYHRRKFVPLPIEGPIISPLRPPTWTETKWVTYLPEYEAPGPLIKAAYGSGNARKIVTQRFMPAVFNEKSYGRHFQTLLWIEEEQRKCAVTNLLQ